MVFIKKHGGIFVGAAHEFSPLQLAALQSLFHTTPRPPVSALGGRTGVVFSTVEGTGPVAVKHYRRGGVVGRFVKNRYIKIGRSRGQREYEMMKKVATMDIRVPEPIAYAWQGRPFYRAWLITRKIDQGRTLSQISREDSPQLQGLMENVCRQIAILIDRRFLHVDLHPGNIIVDIKQQVYLIDFDKSRFCHLSAERLRRHYLNRWQRAVKKHQLPDLLTNALFTGLNEKRT